VVALSSVTFDVMKIAFLFNTITLKSSLKEKISNNYIESLKLEGGNDIARLSGGRYWT